MRLPNYAECSLQELYKFLAERHISVKFTRAQAHTKTLYKRDKQERRKLTAVLDKADEATIFRFMELPAELRDQIYEYVLTDITTTEHVTMAELHERMWCVSSAFFVEARDILNRGQYEILPELRDCSDGSSAPAQETYQISSVAPDRVVPNSITLNSITPNSVTPSPLPMQFNMSNMSGLMGQGLSPLVATPQSIHGFTMRPWADRLARSAFRDNEALYGEHR